MDNLKIKNWINKISGIILVSFFIIFILMMSITGIVIFYFAFKGEISRRSLLNLSPLYLCFIFSIVQFINSFKLYFYLKEKRPEVLKKLLIKEGILLFFPEYMRYNPKVFISFMSNIKHEKDKRLKFYKLVYRICLILILTLFILAFILNS